MSVIRSRWLSVVGAAASAALYALPAPAADSFAAGVLACAAESDREHRLDCYDRAVAGYTAGLSGGRRDATAGASAGGTTAAAITGAAPTGAARSSAVEPALAAAAPVTLGTPSPAAAAPAMSAASTVTAASPAAGSRTSAAASAPVAPAAAASAAAGTPRHLAAHIASIDNFPDYVVVHLDNQQIWKQVSDSPAGAVLRTGDAVTIDKEMGSYWLAGPKGEAVQVKLQTPR